MTVVTEYENVADDGYAAGDVAAYANKETKAIADDYTYGAKLANIGNDEVTGFSFVGFFDAEGNEVAVDTTMPYNDLTIYARFDRLTYEITVTEVYEEFTKEIYNNNNILNLINYAKRKEA